ncbi:LAMI_0D12244g1_1 [Lachancea mirantina]|uniref:LAMI_0D12244g1_1 n=1 Tax=Lachancea mirantina TaxID=1230905 RepID=A0A1G4JFI7_9SACH|nr:LAMI_0D12244g1_1 [Lachancea mirantina]
MSQDRQFGSASEAASGNAGGGPDASSPAALLLQHSRLEEDVIPTAIVIKNIPFAIKKEQLLEVIAKMTLPLPYAFNYHFDNGIFRGLAFANFATTEETTQVVQTLNGKEIGGRKLRVEYKKMLPQAERERIERGKREKRGQLEEQHRSTSNVSLQSLGKSAAPGPNSSHVQPGAPGSQPGLPSNGGALTSATGNTLNSPASSSQIFGSFMNGPSQNVPNQSSLLSSQNTASSMMNPGNGNAQPGTQNLSHASGAERYYAPLPASTNMPLPPQQLDFNDPDTLEIYSQLLLFKDREKNYHELAYPTGLSAAHKRVINVLCSYLGLVEVYDPSFIVIRRKALDHAALQSHLQQQGQLPVMQPLQPSSTGGSLSKSHSYTSLLQAHASAAAAAIVHPQSQHQTPAQSPLMQPTALHHMDSQQQQQQSLLRQQSSQTPSSSILHNRIPTGYATKATSTTNNPLLRNSGVSPPSAATQPNTVQRMPSFYSQTPSTPNLNETRFVSQRLDPQNTNGSIHSNYSMQSFQEPVGELPVHDIMYSTVSQLGLGPDLDEGLSRSLSGLDLQVKKNLWG